ncbi:uncharacterized protein LOC123691482 [Colias croceus]|uniref:uncharacterized protein LOC123691482 n=1 Tax=Colias crocea TaxID=72248 RepID=UPI001E280FC0|nr:uncharacterized protein LOC123691482 [Colias croceus]
MDVSNIFTDEQDEALINLVSQHAILYDLSETGYKKQPKKDKIWGEIGRILNKSGDSCKKRWKNIKDTYFRQKRKNKSGTGSAAPKNPRSKFYTYANLLSFLETAPRERLTLSNIQNDYSSTQDTQMPDELNESSDSHIEKQIENVTEFQEQLDNIAKTSCTTTTSTTVTPSQNVQNSAKIPKSNKRQKNDILNYLQKREESPQKALDKISDDEELLVSFSDHLKSVLKMLPPILRIKAKNELYGVLTKYELLSLEPSHNISSASSPYSPGYILPEQGAYSPVQNTTDPLTAVSMSHAPEATSVHYSNSANLNSVQIYQNNIPHSSTDIHRATDLSLL